MRSRVEKGDVLGWNPSLSLTIKISTYRVIVALGSGKDVVDGLN